MIKSFYMKSSCQYSTNHDSEVCYMTIILSINLTFISKKKALLIFDADHAVHNGS